MRYRFVSPIPDTLSLMRILTQEQARAAFTRRLRETPPTPEIWKGRILESFGEALSPEEAVGRILQGVRERGDAGLLEWTIKLDDAQATLEGLQVTEEELEDAEVSPPLFEAIHTAISRVWSFHDKQPGGSWTDFGEDGTLGQMVRPLERVGLYVPGGTAPLVSSLIHTAVPALVAGVSELVVCTPPGRDGKIHPALLVTARELGISKVFKVGGAQAIGAMAYGTDLVPKVDKIAGPGNLFVVVAKKLVYGAVGIEALPGPTETLVLADESANPRFVAADLLAQAEHIGAFPVLVSTSKTLLEEVEREIHLQLEALPEPNRGWARDSLLERYVIVLADSLAGALELSNLYAPEHLCLLVKNPWDSLGRVEHAGGVFVGEDSMEALGDYAAGPSHVMPTSGTARFSSPVNVRDFQKIISVVGLSRGALERVAPFAARLARAEGLEAHARAMEARLEPAQLEDAQLEENP